jgi:hypothetical protein
MKRVLVLALSTILLISGAPANAALKAGSTCKTLGQIKAPAGKEFTCIKKGSRLVWSKGKIVITSKKVNKTPAPVESAAPVEIEAPTEGQSVKPVSPGAFCAPAGATGKSAKDVVYTCKTSDTDTRNRWRQ